MDQRRLRFGVNYVPADRWWYSWTDWDAQAIHRDLRALAALGFDHVRVHCLWTIFQPNSNYVSPQALDRLGELLDTADAAGLDVQVTVLNGWLSGFAFFPAWVGPFAGGAVRNMFTDSGVVAAEKQLFAQIAQRIANHPRFLGFDLGNELDVLFDLGHAATVAETDAWAADMLAHCAALAPGKLHVNGVDHRPWFADTGFSRRGLATTGAATSLHTWIKFTGALDRYGFAGTGSRHLAEYAIELAKAYHDDPHRAIWIQEFGASTAWMPSDAIADFAEETIRSAATCADVWGFTWWCSHDLDPQLHGFDPLEYDLGLIDVQQQVKPAGQRIAQLIAELHRTPPVPITRPIALVLPDDQFANDRNNRGWTFGDAYMQHIAAGVRPSVVLASCAADAAYLRARGITTLIWLNDNAARTHMPPVDVAAAEGV